MKYLQLAVISISFLLFSACGGKEENSQPKDDFDVNRANELIAKFDSNEPFTEEEIAETAKIYIAAVEKAIAQTNDPDNKSLGDAYEALFQFNTENSSVLSLVDILRANEDKLDPADRKKVVMAENRLTETIDKFGSVLKAPTPKDTSEGDDEIPEIVQNNEEHIMPANGQNQDDSSDY